MEPKDNATRNDCVKIICPRADELSVIVNNVRCDECGLSFSNEPRLRMHVLKIHEHKNLKKNVKENVRYHCPEIMCVYALRSQRYFTTMKYLKQHYLKVHAAKTFACSQCDKSFSTEAARLAHLRICGVQFTCNCLRIFGTYEALLTHGKRAGHAIDEKYKKTLVRKQRGKSPTQWSSQRGNKPVTILPNPTNKCTYPSAAMKIAFDVAVQTDEVKLQRRIPNPAKAGKRRESRETQTSPSSREKRARKSAETQTFRREAAIEAEKNRFPKELVLNENFTEENLFLPSPLVQQHDVALQDFWEEKNTSLGTQTSPEKDFLEALSDSVAQTDLVSTFYCRNDDERDARTNCLDIVENSCYPYESRNGISRSDPMLTTDSFADRHSSIETQTEIAQARDHENPFETRNFALSSNNETQTTENFDEIEQLFYSNTCTQTCNDILPEDLGLSDIQTQTVWPELDGDATISAETQTVSDPSRRRAEQTLASSCRSWLNTLTSHTETQTDLLSIFDELA